MPSLVLTPKTAVKSKWDGVLPSADITVVNTGTPSSVEVTGNGFGAGLVNIPNLTVGQKIAIRIKITRNTGGGTATFSVRKADGITTLISSTMNGVAFLHLVTTVTSLADWQGIRFYIDSGGNGQNHTVHAETLLSFTAEFSNNTDILNILYLIDKVYMIGDGEYLQGVQTSTQDTDWVEVDYGNGAVSGLVFSANSGNLLFTWDGSIVGVSV